MRLLVWGLHLIIIVGLGCSGLDTSALLDAEFIIESEDDTPPVLISADAEAGSTEIVLVFSEPIFSVSSQSIKLDWFDYNDRSLGGATEIVTIVDSDGSDSKLVLEVDVELATSDNIDEIIIASSVIEDIAGNELASVTKNVGLTFTPPVLLSATTMDADSNFQIDHYKLEFSTDVIDATFPGFVQGSLGSAQSTWFIDSESIGVVMAHGDAAPEQDFENDNTIYLRFYEGQTPDTGTTPELTTAASPGLLDFDPSPLPQITSSSIYETDGVAPRLVTPAGLVSTDELEMYFSEPVYSQSGGTVTTSAFSYDDGSSSDAGSILSMGDGDGSDGRIKIQFNASFTFTDADDEITILADQIYDAAGIAVTGADFNVHTGVKQIEGGRYFTCAVFYTGKLRCWGDNTFGQLGYNHTTKIGDGVGPSISAAGDVPVGGDVEKVSAGGEHMCALLMNGSVRCWGRNTRGKLGYGHEDDVGDGIGDSIIDAGDVNLGQTAIDVTAGDGHSCAVLQNGDVVCWGASSQGATGPVGSDIGDDPGELPATAIPLGGMASQVMAGQTYSCAIMSNSNVRCWGESNEGELGYENTQTINSGGEFPPAEVDIGVQVQQIGTSLEFNGFSCVLTATNGVRCWGTGGGMLGYGLDESIGNEPNEMPPPDNVGQDVNIGDTAIDIAVGADSHTCAVLSAGNVRCWGFCISGRLGYDASYGEVGNDPGEMPPPDGIGQDVNLPGPAGQITAGRRHSCALLTTGDVVCWGEASSGQLGYGNTDDVGDGVGPNVGAQGVVPIY